MSFANVNGPQPIQVKFFERKKLTRKIRSVDSTIKKSESSKDAKKLNKEREHIKEDLAVCVYGFQCYVDRHSHGACMLHS